MLNNIGVAAESGSDNMHFWDYVKIVRKRILIFTILFVIIAAFGIFVGRNLPNKYTAVARVKINPVYEQAALNVFDQRFYRDNYWLATEFELIKSDKVLERIIDNVKINGLSLKEYYRSKNTPTLQKNICKALGIDYRKVQAFFDFFKSKEVASVKVKPSKEQMDKIYKKSLTDRLRSMISIQTDNETRFVAIQVTAVASAKEAQVIANALVKAYGAHKVESKLATINEGLSVLKTQVRERKVVVEKLKEQVSSIREKYKLTFLQDQVVSQSNVMEVERLRSELGQARVDLAIHQQTLNKVNKMSQAELEEALGIIVTDSQGYLKLKNELNESVINYELLKIDLGENHQKIKRAQKRMNALRIQMDERLAGVKSGFKLQYDKAKAKVDQLGKELEIITSKYSGVSARHVQEFNTAVTELQGAVKHLSELEDRLRKEEINVEIPRSGVTMASEAILPLRPSSPNKLRNVFISLFIALVISFGIVFFLEYLDTTIKSIDELEKVTGVQALATIPQKTPLFFKAETPGKYYEEAYRILYTNLSFVGSVKEDGKIVAFTSSGAGEGKSTTTSNLSHILARAGKKVLVVDADLHRPVQHSMNETEAKDLGLIDLLTDNASLEDVIVESEIDNLSHIYAGVNFSRFAGLVNSKLLEKLFLQLRDRFDLVIIDCPPVLGVNDSAVIASHADDVVMVVKDHGYASKSIVRALHILESSGANVVGTVFNNVRTLSDHYGSYYYYSASKKS